MSGAELIALAERCEAAAGPDQDELLKAAWAAIFPKPDLADEPDWQGPGTKREPLFHEWKVRQLAFQAMLSVRASLDAAMSLVPEGWRPLLDSTDSEYSPHWAELYSNGADYPIAKSRGSSLALAICGAALRARASAEGGE